MKYITWLNEWLEDFVRPSVKVRTYDRYRQLIEQHISQIGGTELGNLSAMGLQRFITGLLQNGNHRTGEGLSPNSVNQVITVLKSSLRTAHVLGLVPEYVADNLKRPKGREKRVECFSLAEQKRIEGAIMGGRKDKMYGIVICLYTGLRLGELLALKWEDVDLSKGTLTVMSSCYDGRNGVVMSEPKTPSSRRVIPLPKRLLPILRGIKRRSRSPFVISSNSGKAICLRSYQRSFELLLNKLDIPHRGFHSLRHTFATRALECGMDVRTLAEILGHKNPTVTLNRYAHSLMEHKQDMMNRLGGLLKE